MVFRAALPGIVGGVLLAISRAIGETMIVVMAAGLAANLTANPLEAVTTVTVQIVTLLVGDQEFDSPKTLAAFALGLVLFLVTLGTQRACAAHREEISGALRMTARTAQETQELVARSLRRRYWAEKRFRAYGVLAVLFGIAFVVVSVRQYHQ